MVKIDFTGAGQYWLSCPERTDDNRGVTGDGALWIDLGECKTEADLLAAALVVNTKGTRPAHAREFRRTANAAQRAELAARRLQRAFFDL